MCGDHWFGQVVNASYLSASSSPLDVLPLTRAFCVEHGLSDDNQQFLAARVRETVEQVRGRWRMGQATANSDIWMWV